MQKFIDNAIQWSLSLIGICFWISTAGSVVFRGYSFLRYGENPEMPISIVVGNYQIDWVGVQKIVDFLIGLPIEIGLIAAGLAFLSWAGSVDDLS